jgi:hypothetical protein
MIVMTIVKVMPQFGAQPLSHKLRL